jgi:hypothetical protein
VAGSVTYYLEEERRNMVNILIRHPVVHLYLLFVGALLIAFICDVLRHPPELTRQPGDDRRPLGPEAKTNTTQPGVRDGATNG